VVSLGDAALPEREMPAMARAVENHLAGHTELLPAELSEEAAGWVRRILQLASRSKSARPVCSQTIDGVVVDRVQSENIVQLGPQLVALKAWESLGLTSMLQEAGLNASQIATAQLLVAGRLIEPSSEWALIDWAERTALPELLDVRVTKSTKDRLYHVGDALFARHKAIEAALRRREAGLFDSAGSIVLYDMTNTHFEGLCKKNPKARHGNNKQKRNDCRQVAIGMAFDGRGLALAHDVFEGNIAETKTLAHMLDRLALPGGEAAPKPVVILDAGFASQENIALLKERGLGYVVNITRGSRARYAQDFAAGGFEPVPGRDPKAPVEVKRVADPKDPERTLNAADTWSLYMILLQAEEGFACLKGSLGLRPNFHQLEHRVEAHVFISVLAYHLLSWIRETLRPTGESRDWKTLCRLLSSHSLLTTALPLTDGQVLRIRKPSQPDPEQSRLYQKLRLDWKASFLPTKSFAKL
jgi:hypothetical protein